MWSMENGSLTGYLGLGIGRYGKFSFLSCYSRLVNKKSWFLFARKVCNGIDCYRHIILR